MKAPLIIALALAAMGAASADAQAQPRDPAAVVGALRPGSVIRATLPDGRRFTGQFALWGDGRLGIRRFDQGVDTLRLAELRTLAVRGRHTKTGAIIGGLAGMGFGVFVGLLSNALCEGGNDCHGASPYLIAIPLFGGGGAGLGAVVGSAFPNWRRVLP